MSNLSKCWLESLLRKGDQCSQLLSLFSSRKKRCRSVFNIQYIYICVKTYLSTPHPQLEQFTQWPEVKRLLASGSSVDTSEYINAFSVSVLAMLALEDSPEHQSKITCFPLGGQHYCAANEMARIEKPLWPSLKTYQCLIFFPMPLKFAQKVNIILWIWGRLQFL